MKLRNSDYQSFVKRIKKNSSKLIIYGAGMIGQIIVPYLVREYDLYDAIDCFIDIDKRKCGQKISIDGYLYETRTPEYLEGYHRNVVILITNSKFYPILNFLDGIETLDCIEGYILPMMQLHEIEVAKTITVERICQEKCIPKKIHYCWFGGKKIPDFLQTCIQSWRVQCPDYEVIEWNENNYDVNMHLFTKQAFEQSKWGFISDVARLDILYEHGGIYLDTDVTLIKNLDNCLYQPGFIGVEKWGNINSGGGCGFIKKHPMVKRMLDYRDKYSFVMDDGSLNIETNGMYETIPFLQAGFKPNNTLQIIEDVTVYPSYVNHPYDYMSCETKKKDATISIHHFYGGWMEYDDRQNRGNTQNEYVSILQRANEQRG